MSKELRRFSYLVCKSIEEEIEHLHKEIETEEGSGFFALPRIGSIRALKTVKVAIVRAVKQIEK